MVQRQPDMMVYCFDREPHDARNLGITQPIEATEPESLAPPLGQFCNPAMDTRFEHPRASEVSGRGRALLVVHGFEKGLPFGAVALLIEGQVTGKGLYQQKRESPGF